MSERRWFLALVVFLTLVLAAGPARADGPNRAGLVVRFDDERVSTVCVGFSEDSLTGLELLARSGLDVGLGFGGRAVCRIEDLGCEGDNCFCQCTGADCRYWAYFRLGPDGTWKYSQVGAGDVIVRDGDVEGWSWGPGVKAPPPAISLDEICVSQETLTPSPTPLMAVATSPPTPPAAPTIENPLRGDRLQEKRAWDLGPVTWDLPASYGVFALVVLGLIGVLVVLGRGRAARR